MILLREKRIWCLVDYAQHFVSKSERLQIAELSKAQVKFNPNRPNESEE
jgi:hypothetical protein